MADTNQGLAQSKAAEEFIAKATALGVDPAFAKLITEYFQVNPQGGIPPIGPP